MCNVLYLILTFKVPSRLPAVLVVEYTIFQVCNPILLSIIYWAWLIAVTRMLIHTVFAMKVER